MGRLPVLAAVLTVLFALAASPVTATTNCIFTTGPGGPGGPTMKLKANCTTDETIFVPDGFTLDGGNHTITAVDPPGGHFKGAIVQNVDGATTMNVQRLKLKASNLVDPPVCDSGNDRLRGIAMLGVGGTVRDVRIDGLKQGAGDCPEGSGVVANNLPAIPGGTLPPTRSLLIQNVKVQDFQFVGIQVQGQIVAKVLRNQVVGTAEPGIPPSGQFGFFIANGATVELRDNTILQDDTSTNINVIAVFVEDSSKNVIERNTINGAAEGIFVESFCTLFGQGANKNRIAKNNVLVTREGIVLIARVAANSVCAPHVDGNTVDDNDIAAVDGGVDLTGVFVGTDPGPGGYTPVANKNTIKNNTIDGFQFPIFQSGDTNTTIKNNTIIP